MANSIEIVNIPISKLKPDPDNAIAFSEGDIDYLANNINQHGFNGAITVFKLSKPENGLEYQILFGHRRTLAMKSLGKKSIPAIITKKPSSDLERGELLLADNIQGRRLSSYDWIKAISYYNSLCHANGFKGNFPNKASEFFNFSVPTIKKYIALSKLIPELQEFTKNAEFPTFSLEQAKSFTPEEQMMLANMIKGYYKENDAESGDKLSTARVTQMITIILNQSEAQKNKKERMDTFSDKLNAGIVKKPEEENIYEDNDEEDISYTNIDYTDISPDARKKTGITPNTFNDDYDDYQQEVNYSSSSTKTSSKDNDDFLVYTLNNLTDSIIDEVDQILEVQDKTIKHMDKEKKETLIKKFHDAIKKLS